MNLKIEENDLKILYLNTYFAYNNATFEDWKTEVKKAYIEYFDRNTHNVEKYGEPKTFSQWINRQILSIT